MSKRCFVISPIGDEGSPTREEADLLLDLVITPALAPAGFEVIRVDRLKGAKAITGEIIQLIQEADLCVIVLTGQNPNVYYEMGRRHETGKPFIHLIRKGEDIPFDLAPIRTIMYDDISQSRAAYAAQREIMDFVSEIENSPSVYGPAGTGVSLATLATAIDRIERKLIQVTSRGPVTGPLSKLEATDDDPFRNPWEIFNEAVARRDINAIIAVLPRIEMVFGPADRLLYASSLLANAGIQLGADTLQRLLSDHLDNFPDIQDLQQAVGTIVNYYDALENEQEGISKIEPVINCILKLEQVQENGKLQAYFLNQLQKLYWGAQDTDTAISILDRVLELSPNEPSYHYNASMAHERKGQLSDAVRFIDRAMELDAERDRSDSDHLMQAIDVYIKIGRYNDAQKLYDVLLQIAPDKAARSLRRGENQKYLKG